MVLGFSIHVSCGCESDSEIWDRVRKGVVDGREHGRWFLRTCAREYIWSTMNTLWRGKELELDFTFAPNLNYNCYLSLLQNANTVKGNQNPGFCLQSGIAAFVGGHIARPTSVHIYGHVVYFAQGCAWRGGYIWTLCGETDQNTLTIVLVVFKSSVNALGHDIWLENSRLRISASTTMYICARPSKTEL